MLLCLTLLLSAVAYSAEPANVILGTANTVVLRGEVTDESAQRVAIDVLRLDAARMNRSYTIYLVLDTPGGSVDAGESLIEVLQTVPNLKTITIFAASMGSSIVEALPGERLILGSGILMFHRARGAVSGQFETGELETRLDFYKRLVRRMEQRSADRMGISLRSYKRKVKDELWYSASDAVSLNAADAVITLQCSQLLIERADNLEVDTIFGKLSVQFSGCPLLRAPMAITAPSAEAIEAYHKNRNRMYEIN